MSRISDRTSDRIQNITQDSQNAWHCRIFLQSGTREKFHEQGIRVLLESCPHRLTLQVRLPLQREPSLQPTRYTPHHKTLVCNFSQRPQLKTRSGIWLANNFPSFNLNPIIVLWFFVEFVTYMPDAMYSTRIMEIPVGGNNGTTFMHKPERGNGRGTT